MSLGTWCRDYIYVPMGGNRVSKIKWIRNITIVWLLTGLWHGAAWNFIIWGLYFGILLMIEKLFLKKFLDKLPKIISRIYVLFIVMVSFVIYSGNTTSEIFKNLGGLVGINTTSLVSPESIYYLKSFLVVLVIGIIGATRLPKTIVTSEKLTKITNVLEPIFLLVILVLSTSYIIDSTFNPFLYFRF